MPLLHASRASTAAPEQLGDHMVVFGRRDLWSLGVSPSDAHEGAENLSPSIAIIPVMPQATVVFLLHRLQRWLLCACAQFFRPIIDQSRSSFTLCILVSVSLVVLK